MAILANEVLPPQMWVVAAPPPSPSRLPVPADLLDPGPQGHEENAWCQRLQDFLRRNVLEEEDMIEP